MREFIICRDAVAVIVYCPSARKMLLSRQFRLPAMHALQDVEQAWIYEAVAGIVGDGESAWETAVRELEEEAGVLVEPDRLQKVGVFFPSPGISNEQIHVYIAAADACVPENPSGGLAEENEAIVSAWLTYEAVDALLSEGKIRDFKTYTAIQAVKSTASASRVEINVVGTTVKR